MKKSTGRKNDRGYSLVGIMGVMMFALILTTAAAPKLKYEAQREKEEEMLWRGQQISTALKRYQAVRGNFPTDLKDLVNGINIGTKKMRFLRPSALCDPMTPCTPGESNWRAVNPGDPLVKELLDAYVATREKGQAIGRRNRTGLDRATLPRWQRRDHSAQ
jgi:type II secretory pathway pseudopilin PulG